MNQYEQDLRTQAENKKKKDDMIEKGLLLGGAILGGIALYNAHVNNNAPKETLDNLFANKISPNPIESGDNTIVPPVIEPDLDTIVETPIKDAGTQQFKVISGGQTGADILGVKLAKEYGFDTGGTVNIDEQGRIITEVNNYGQNNPQWDDGIDREQFGFTKIQKSSKYPDYPSRTRENVLNSDGTVYFATDEDGRGLRVTQKFAQELNKPFLLNPKTAEEIAKFREDNKIWTMNVAGNRGSNFNSIKEATENTLKGFYDYMKTGKFPDKGTEQMQEIQINEATRGKVLPYHDVWTREMVENDPNNYYVFGDNTDDRLNTHYVPSQTQAVIRGLPNAIGVDTKLNRGIADSSYLTDDYARSEAYKNHLKDVERQILKAISEGHNVYLPYTGGKGLALGNGKAQLPKRAPEAYRMLKELASKLLLRYR